jgi:nucleoside phosphorylase
MDTWTDDHWLRFLGEIDLPIHSLDSVMDTGRVARLTVLRRELQTLTILDSNGVKLYLHAAVSAYARQLSDSNVNVPSYREWINTEVVPPSSSKVGNMTSAREATAPGKVDVAIITIREDEFKAMLARLPGYSQVNQPTWAYQHVELATTNQEGLNIAVGRIMEQGSLSAQALAGLMIQELRPQWILVVGIAGAISAQDYSLGDVLLSQRVHDFNVSAKAEGRPPSFQDFGGPLHLDVENLLTHLPANTSRLGDWNQPGKMTMAVPEIHIPDSLDDPRLCGPEWARQSVIRCLMSKFQSPLRDTNPKFHIGPVIDASMLVMDPEVVDIWQKTTSHACGIEMEFAGVVRAARHFGNRDTRVMAIRGFSDVVGFRRGHEWTEYACHSAASFANALLRSGLLKIS